MPSITHYCPQCQKHGQIEIIDHQTFTCPHCQKEWGRLEAIAAIFENCPICQCRQFYAQKDFNQAMGCLIMLIGIVLVPWTYGLSLPIFWLVDLYFYRRVPTMAVCYQCGAEIRNVPIPEHLKPFLHPIGEKYDRRKEKNSQKI